MLKHQPCYCPMGSDVQTICVNKECDHPALQCGNAQCRCADDHVYCDTRPFGPIIDTMFQNIKQALVPLETLTSWYDNLIKAILIDKNQLMYKISSLSSMAVQQQQAKLLERIQTGNTHLVTGRQTANLIEQLEKGTMEADAQPYFDLLKIQAYKTKRAVEQSLYRFKMFWTRQKGIGQEQARRRIKQCEVRYIHVNGKWVGPQPVLKDYSLQAVQGLDINQLNEEAVVAISAFCVNLRKLEVGIASSCSMSDKCCEVIAIHLRLLHVLKVHHCTEVTDEGALAIAASLQNLQTLQLVDCQLSTQGKQRVKFLQSKCEKIKL